MILNTNDKKLLINNFTLNFAFKNKLNNMKRLKTRSINRFLT
jgi:hypothetical protein